MKKTLFIFLILMSLSSVAFAGLLSPLPPIHHSDDIPINNSTTTVIRSKYDVRVEETLVLDISKIEDWQKYKNVEIVKPDGSIYNVYLSKAAHSNKETTKIILTVLGFFAGVLICKLFINLIKLIG